MNESRTLRLRVPKRILKDRPKSFTSAIADGLLPAYALSAVFAGTKLLFV